MKTKLNLLTLAAAGLALLCVTSVNLRSATLYVSSTDDSGPGSLRAALAGATNGDIIDATAVAGTITLTSGELPISHSATLLGPGSATLTVSGNHASRVFNVTGTNVTIRGLRIADGQTAGIDSGMGINAAGGAGSVITVRDCVITNNSTTYNGGGIYNNPGVTMTISNCTVSGNSAGASGGGIDNERATLIVVNSTLSGNSAGSSSYGQGGGIYNDGSYGSATLTINASTLNNNTCPYGGGGINNNGGSGSATLTINASTLNNNSAPGSYGGGIDNEAYPSGSASVTVNTCTFSGNSASGGGGIENGFMGNAALKVNACTFSGNSANVGSAIFNYNSSGKTVTLEIGDTILNQPGATGQSINNTSGTVTSRGYNLSSDDGGNVLNAATDQHYTDPKLGPLQNNGGPTFTHALLSGSPAIDKGKTNAVPGLASGPDQRGLTRPVDFASIANATGGDGSDIGAFEMQYSPVTSIADNGPGTLRDALAATGNGGTIDATGVSGTITLTSGQLSVSNSVTILGPGPRTLTVSGNHASRVFYVTGTNVTIRGLTIANGQSALNGAGINAAASPGSVATVSDCIITNNSTTVDGGGIYNNASVIMTITNCTICGNSASAWGGGIYNHGESGRMAKMTINTSTVSGNSAASGGGIINFGFSGSATLTVDASTISSNSASSDRGGGVYNLGNYSGSASLTINACTFSGNSASFGGGIFNEGYEGSATLEIADTILNASAAGGNIFNLYGTVISDGYNLSSDGADGFLTATGDQINTAPLLGPLQDNGGPTWTHALLAGSPAIDQGKTNAIPALACATDQRGLARRVDNPYLANAADGDGSDIGAFEVQGSGGYDTDADGLPDFWELAYFGNLSQSGTDDFDGDGQNNGQEYLADTSPVDANDYLHITSFTRSGTYNTLRWTSKPTRFYRVERCATLDASSPWETIITIDVPGWNNVGFDNTGPRYFYRIRVLQP
jgi:Chlamydia polymorphic membrane protein (Chlamydia_PMP) repeat